MHSIPGFGRSARFWRLVTAALAAVAGVSGSYGYAGFTPAFLGEPASAFVVRVTPGVVMNAAIDTLGSLAQPLSFLLALSLLVAVLTALVALALEVEAAAGYHYLGVPLAALAVGAGAAWTTGDVVGAAAAALPVGAVVFAIEYAAAHDPLSVRTQRNVDRTRRATLQAGFGVVSLTGAAYVLGKRRTPDSSVPFLGGGNAPPLEIRRRLDEASTAAFDLPDAPGLVSRIGEFYTVDINNIDPIVDADGWALSITGAVGTETTVDYDRLREMEAEHFFSALRCVGEELNSVKLDNALWTGVPLEAVLEGVDPEGEWVACRAVDGYWNTIPADLLAESYLVYGMNGRVLPREHGHPVRLIVPGHWGEVNVKWIDELEFTDDRPDGYWEERGWDGTGEVKTVAKLWSIDRDGDEVTLGGHAYAGDRGVDAVEVSTDGGETWTGAELTPPLEGPDPWRQWRYAFEPTREHEVLVRAVDGTGTVQTGEETGPVPDGAAGWVSETIGE